MTERAGQLVPMGADQRRAGRYTAWIARALAGRENEGESEGSEVMLLDLSATGCRISSQARFADGERIWLRFQGSPTIPATVVWYRYGHAGCTFDDPIPLGFVHALTLANF